MAESFRAGGIHWAATMDAGGFARGARAVKAEATRLQQELKAIAKMDSPFAQRILGARAVESERIRAAEQERFHRQTTENMQAALRDMARYETKSTVLVAANRKMGMSFKDLNNSLKSAFGRGSDFKEFLELVAGAGAIAGIGLLANAVERMGGAFKQGTKDMVTGAKNWQQAVADMARSVPILGSIAGGFADFALSLSPSSFGGSARASFTEDMVNAEIANAANARYGQMMEELRAAASGRGRIGSVETQTRQRLRILNELSAAGGIGAGQFREGRKAIEAERDRLLKDMRAEDLAARIGDLFQTKANTVNHWLKKMQADVEAFNERVDKRLEAATARWADRIQTKTNTFMHWFRNLEERRDAFEEQQRKKRDKEQEERDRFIGGARSIFERLKQEQSAPVVFASAQVRGSQEEFASRMQRLFGGIGGAQSEAELMRQAIRLQEDANAEDKRINRLFEEFLRKPAAEVN